MCVRVASGLAAKVFRGDQFVARIGWLFICSSTHILIQQHHASAQIGEQKWPVATHLARIALHDIE